MKTLDKTSVLLVEDDVDLRNTINENLKAVDYKVYATKKSIESLDLFKKYDIDICILDIEMTGIDGFALAAQIKMLNPDVPPEKRPSVIKAHSLPRCIDLMYEVG